MNATKELGVGLVESNLAYFQSRARQVAQLLDAMEFILILLLKPVEPSAILLTSWVSSLAITVLPQPPPRLGHVVSMSLQ